MNTGEVVAGDPTADQRLVVGDTVNVAARLEQAAPENEVLVGEPTYRLVRNSVEVEAVEPLELKGKAERVPAYRLLSVEEVGTVPRRQLPLVGREAELATLVAEFDAAVAAGTCRLVTIVAQAGRRQVTPDRGVLRPHRRRARRPSAAAASRTARGITFWPLVEIVRQAAGSWTRTRPTSRAGRSRPGRRRRR